MEDLINAVFITAPNFGSVAMQVFNMASSIIII